MKAMVLNTYGADSKFEAAELALPEPTAGHVRLRVAATSVNTVDTMIRQMGKDLPLSPDLPAVLGMDFAGTVDAVGEGVTDFAVGDEVYGCAGGLADLQGALAEVMVADARLVARKPSNLSMRDAAALPLVGITAFEGLERAGLASGKKVLVHGGAGGVGHVAVQLAVHAGADVYATCSSEQQMEVVRGYGATAIDRRSTSVSEYVAEHTGGAGFDIVYDSVGGANMLNSFEAAALNGHVVTTVSLLELDMTLAHFKGLSVHVVFMLIPMLHDHGRDVHGDILSRMAEIAEAGRLVPLVDAAEFGLDEVGAAHDHLTGRKALGKVVVTV